MDARRQRATWPVDQARRIESHGSYEPEGGMVQARISIEGDPIDSAALWEWLRNEQDLRGHLRAVPTRPAEGTMGGGTDIVVQTTAALAGASILWKALARSIATFLTQRRSDVAITIDGPDGRSVTVTAHRVADAESLIRTILVTDAEVRP